MSTDVRASYTGTFEHAFDAKGRITVPSEWRWETFEPRLFVLPSSGTCLKVYPESWLGKLQEQFANLKTSDPKRQGLELLASKAQSTTFDQQGRIMVKQNLRQDAKLKKEAVLVGSMDHFQIWDRSAWTKKAESKMTVEEALAAIGL